MRFLRLCSICLLLLCAALTLHAQSVTLHGTVKSTQGEAVPYASVRLLNSQGQIIAFAAADINGKYSLGTAAVPAGAMLQASAVGYAAQSTAFSPGTTAYNFSIAQSAAALANIKFESRRPAIKTSGDTTTYKVGDFTSANDRVIGDVIKRLPGVEVDTRGKISYNGKAVSTVKIDGDNLLDDRYTVATKSIDSRNVDKVQVLENDQPIKMLQNKVPSNDVALNLVIKDDARAKLNGRAQLGAGLPRQYQGELNAMLFKKRWKAINYIKGNNVGTDVADDVTSHNYAAASGAPAPMLGMGAAGNPRLPESRYLFNRSALVNASNLYKYTAEKQLRVNAFYLHDRQHQAYYKSQQVYLPADTVSYTEQQYNTYRPNILSASITYLDNSTDHYLENTFTGHYNRLLYGSSLNTGGTAGTQAMHNNAGDVSNTLSLMRTLKSGRIITLNSYLAWYNLPETLNIQPGYNAAAFNGGLPYAALTQYTNTPTWLANNIIGTRFSAGDFSISTAAGLNYQHQRLNSSLTLTQSDGGTRPALDSAVNNLTWQRTQLYIRAGADRDGRKLKLNLSLPLTLAFTRYADAGYALSAGTQRLLLSPAVNLQYYTRAEQYINFSGAYNTSQGSIADVYPGYILTNYRSLNANYAPLSLTNVSSLALGYNYRRAVRMLFYNIQLRWQHTGAQSIASSTINSVFQRRVLLPLPNHSNIYSVTTGASKYYFPLRVTLSGGLSWQNMRYNQLVNGILLPYNNYTTGANAGAEGKVGSTIVYSYKALFTYNKGAAAGTNAASPRYLQVQHTATLSYMPAENINFNVSADDYVVNNPLQHSRSNYAFADAGARLTLGKKRIDVDVKVQNLFNTKTFSSVLLTANNYTASSYTLPGRMLLAAVTFNF